MTSRNRPTKRQIDKFRELAREQECDQSEDSFDATLQTVSKHRPAKSQDDANNPESPQTQARKEPERR